MAIPWKIHRRIYTVLFILPVSRNSLYWISIYDWKIKKKRRKRIDGTKLSIFFFYGMNVRVRSGLKKSNQREESRKKSGGDLGEIQSSREVVTIMLFVSCVLQMNPGQKREEEFRGDKWRPEGKEFWEKNRDQERER